MGNIRYFFITALLIAGIFSECKKGPEDPKISLKSRKDRISERWTLTRGKVGVTVYTPNQPVFNSNFELSPGTCNLTQTGTLIVYLLTYDLFIEFQKDGTFTLNETFDGTSTKGTGKWNFCGRIGEKKNKEQVAIQLDQLSSGSLDDCLFNNFSPELVYDIVKLSKDELKITANSNYEMNSNGEKTNIQAEYVFKKQ